MMKTVCLFLGAIAYVHGASIPEHVPSGAALEAAGGVSDFNWKYDTQGLANAKIPAEWKDLTGYGTCGSGTKQSPINIDPDDVMTETTDVGAVNTTMFDMDIPGALANTGRVLRWFAMGTVKPTISGGPLDSDKVYGLSHIDFHFGSSNTQGSEHKIDSKQYPMEMEMVFFDSAFADHTAALASSDEDALATISQLFEVDTTTNDGLTPITGKITDIEHATTLKRKKREARQGRQADETVTDTLKAESVTINIEKIIGMATIDNYYYYDGSMTEPACTENTRWIINKDMADVTEVQLAEFRKLQTSDLTGTSPVATQYEDDLADNYRPVQTIDAHKVYERVAPTETETATLFTETQLQVLGGTVAGIVAFNAINGALGQTDVAKSIAENPLTDFISNIDLNPFDDASVVQQRSSVEVAPQQVYAPAYPQPVYQGQGYQQYVAPPAPAQ